MRPSAANHRLDLRDLVLVALLSSAGGVLSAYVGYLGNLINRLFGVPFGAGQLIAGVHVIWPLLARAIIRRFGAGTLTGAVKGVVEFLSGGTHGVVIVLVSAIEGLLVDVGMSMSSRRSLAVMMVSGAAASAANVFVFQAVYFAGLPLSVLSAMTGLALISGAFFGGYLAWDVHGFLVESRLVRSPEGAAAEPRRLSWRRHIVALTTVAVGLGGAGAFYLAVYEPFLASDAIRIEGKVSAPYLFQASEWTGAVTAVTAELKGASTSLPAKEYRGPLLRDVVSAAVPTGAATRLRVIAADGYEIDLDWKNVLSDDRLLLTLERRGIRLVAAAYDGGYWVQQVKRIVVYEDSAS